MLKHYLRALCVCLCFTPFTAHTGDAVTVKNIGLDLANDLALEAMYACRKKGYQVSVVVVDRNGLVRVALRDDLATRFMLQISEEKANLAVMAGTSTTDFRKQRGDIRPEINHLDDIIVLDGGLEIIAGGNRLGAIAVSGAPGGDLDEACAQQALDKYQERLEFLD